jgi:hypothetical protein
MNVESYPFHFFQPTFPDGNVPERDLDLLTKETTSSEAPGLFLLPENPDFTADYVHRIADLESRVRILK